jgi:hypothetical protein
MPKDPKTITINPSNMILFTTNSRPMYPVTMSTPKARQRKRKAINPTTLFSLIELLSSNRCEKNFFIVLFVCY